MLLIHEQIITGITPDNIKNIDTQLDYFLLLTRMASSIEINKIISNMTFSKEFWHKIGEYELDIISCFPEVMRKEAICDFMSTFAVTSHLPKSKLCKYGAKCKSLNDENFKCKFEHKLEIESTKISDNTLTISTFIENLGFIYLDGPIPSYGNRSPYLSTVNRKYCIFRPSTCMLYDILQMRIRFSSNVYVLTNPIIYDIETEKKRLCISSPDDWRHIKNEFHCKHISTRMINIKGILEKVYDVGIWIPYTCEYRCDTIWYHGHGN